MLLQELSQRLGWSRKTSVSALCFLILFHCVQVPSRKQRAHTIVLCDSPLVSCASSSDAYQCIKRPYVGEDLFVFSALLGIPLKRKLNGTFQLLEVGQAQLKSRQEPAERFLLREDALNGEGLWKYKGSELEKIGCKNVEKGEEEQVQKVLEALERTVFYDDFDVKFSAVKVVLWKPISIYQKQIDLNHSKQKS